VSHYTVIVALDPRPEGSAELALSGDAESRIHQLLETALAPFDENLEVEPYREYEEGQPEDNWLYSSLKRSAEHVANGTGILPYEPGELGWSSASSKKTSEEQQAELEKDAATFHALPDPITWTALVKLHNSRYAADESTPLLLSEDGRAYTMSTYSKASKWDWYAVGGRWHNALRVKPAYVGDPAVVGGTRSWVSSEEPDTEFTCDGAPKKMLDFDGMRALAAAKADERYDRYHAIVAGTPEAKPWSYYYGQVEAATITMEEARQLFREQPRVAALSNSGEQNNDFRFYPTDSIENYERPRDVVIAEAINQAIPMYALLDLGGVWHEPGKMGWFGLSTDTPETKADHYRMANEYIDGLDDEIVLVLVDVHI
jgi:hypothetical protein